MKKFRYEVPGCDTVWLLNPATQKKLSRKQSHYGPGQAQRVPEV
jgi:hypothetical protein